MRMCILNRKFIMCEMFDTYRNTTRHGRLTERGREREPRSQSAGSQAVASSDLDSLIQLSWCNRFTHFTTEGPQVLTQHQYWQNH